jgi:tetratricopeptide (TPR) repeat protein
LLGKRFGPTPGKSNGSSLMADLAKMDDADLYRLASDLLGDGKHRNALTVLEELTQRNPQHFMGWYWRATCLDALGNNPLAVQAWTTCVALQPEFATCHHHLGLARFRLKEFARAEQSFSEAYRLDPQIGNALIHRALSLKQQGKYVEAERDLTEALEKEAAPIVAYLFRAEVRRKLNKSAEADADHAEAMKRKADDEWSFSTRGYSQLVLSTPNFDSALSDLESALKINPRNQASLINKMVALDRSGRLAEALEVVELYLNYYPDMAQARVWRAGYLARLGSLAAAQDELRVYEKLAPPSATTYYHIGAVHAAMSKHDSRFKSTAMKYLDVSLARGYDRPDNFRRDSELDPLRGEKGFAVLLERANDLEKRQTVR